MKEKMEEKKRYEKIRSMTWEQKCKLISKTREGEIDMNTVKTLKRVLRDEAEENGTAIVEMCLDGGWGLMDSIRANDQSFSQRYNWRTWHPPEGFFNFRGRFYNERYFVNDGGLLKRIK